MSKQAVYRTRHRLLGLCLFCSKVAKAFDTLCEQHAVARSRRRARRADVFLRAPSAKDAERFHGRSVAVASGCREWIGARFHNGYGSFSYKNATVSAHVFADFLGRGLCPPGMHILHHCDNKLCVRIEHIYRGTRAENMADMASRGRARNQWTGPAS